MVLELIKKGNLKSWDVSERTMRMMFVKLYKIHE